MKKGIITLCFDLDIGVAPITQVTHVRNKIVTFKGCHLM